MDDIKIIDLFFARSELAIEALDGKYGAICHNLSRSILKDQQDAEECVNDAYLGVWNAIPPHRPNPLSVFVCKIVRNISSSDHGFHGDGYRIIKLSCKNDKVCGSVFDFSTCMSDATIRILKNSLQKLFRQGLSLMTDTRGERTPKLACKVSLGVLAIT